MSATAKVVACIAVRMNSRRLERKALADVAGRPLLEQLVERLRRARTLDEIVVCTSTDGADAVLLDEASRLGISGYAGSEDDVLSRLLEAGRRYGADRIVRVTGDNVFTDPVFLDRMVRAQRESGAEYVRTAGLPLGVTAEVLTVNLLDRLAAELPDPAQTEYLIFFAFDPRRHACLVLEAEEPLRRPRYSLSVDTPADLELVRGLFRALPAGPGGPDLADILLHLDGDPAYSGVPDDARIKTPFGGSMTFAEYLDWHARQTALAGRLPACAP